MQSKFILKQPPADWMDIVEQTIEDKCENCKKEIIDPYYFICSECNNIKFCKTCRGIGKSIHEHTLTKVIFFN